MGFLIRSILPFFCAFYLSMIIGARADASQKQYLLLGALFLGIALYLFDTFYQKYIYEKKINKRLLLAAACLSGLLLSAAYPYLLPGGRSEKVASLTITAIGQKNSQAASSEVWILGLQNGGKPYDMGQVKGDNFWERKDGGVMSYQHQPAGLNILIEHADEPSVKFLAHPWSGMVKIFDGKHTDTIDLYHAGTNDNYVYPIRHLQDAITGASAGRLIVLYSLAFIFLFIVFYPVLVIIAGDPKFYYLFNILLGIPLFLFPAFLSLTTGEITLLFVLSYIAGKLVSRALEPGGYLRIGHTRWDVLILVVITGYASFACVGNTFFLGDNSIEEFPTRQLFLFLVFALWFFSIEIAFLQLVWQWKIKLQTSKTSPAPELPARAPRSDLTDRPVIMQIWGLSFLITATIWTLYLLAFFPGVMSSDSLDQWGQATGVRQLNNWHPVFHTLFNRIIVLPFKNPSAIGFVHIIAMSALVASFLTLLYRKGIPKNWLLVFSLIFALFPANGINLVTLWKDIPFTISVLWLTLLIGKIIADPACFSRNKGMYPGLILVLLCVALFRHNGIVVYILTAGGLLFYALQHRIRALLICLAISLVAMIAFNVGVVHKSSVIQVPAGVKLIAPFNGIAVVLKMDTLSDRVEQKMETILPKKEWAGLYSPYWANAYQFRTDGKYTSNLSGLALSEAMRMYASTLYHHPFLVTRDRLQGSDIVWNIDRPKEVYNSVYNTELEANNYGFKQEQTDLRDTLLKYLKASEGVGSLFLWRVGIYNILILLLMSFVFRTRSKKVLLLFLPWLGCTLSLFPAIAWQEFRYIYYVVVLFGFLLFSVMSDIVPFKTSFSKSIK